MSRAAHQADGFFWSERHGARYCVVILCRTRHEWKWHHFNGGKERVQRPEDGGGRAEVARRERIHLRVLAEPRFELGEIDVVAHLQARIDLRRRRRDHGGRLVTGNHRGQRADHGDAAQHFLHHWRRLAGRSFA